LKKIVIATGNKDKLREIKNIWGNIKGVEIDWMGNYPDIKEIEETGNTLHENSSIKANYVLNKLNCPAVADDTGLFVKYLNGAPGVYSSRFAGENATYEDNVEKLLKELRGVSKEERSAEFHTVVCLSRPGKEDIYTEGIVEGYITEEKRGVDGFGYDPIFEVKGTGKTYAQMTLEEKNSLSHRYKAFDKMGEIIASQLQA
jgi:XTP/dITP diphosphohydrolase